MVKAYHLAHAHMFVKLKIVLFKVTEGEKENQVVGARKAGLSDPSRSLEVLPGSHELGCPNTRR